MTINVSKYTGVALIYIYSNNGNIVFSEAKNISGEGTVTINVQDLETGNYSLDIILNNSSYTGELILN